MVKVQRVMLAYGKVPVRFVDFKVGTHLVEYLVYTRRPHKYADMRRNHLVVEQWGEACMS